VPRRLSYSAVAILTALADGHRYGFDIIDRTGLKSANVYPTLGKLEDDGLVSSSWEAPRLARAEKRPPRRYYVLRPAGREALAAALDQFRALERGGRRSLRLGRSRS
jgi:PadR family transcriptional regulator PadR